MSPTGGARNAIMIGFLSDAGFDVSFVQWLSMGVSYTLFMIIVMSLILYRSSRPMCKSQEGESKSILMPAGEYKVQHSPDPERVSISPR